MAPVCGATSPALAAAACSLEPEALAALPEAALELDVLDELLELLELDEDELLEELEELDELEELEELELDEELDEEPEDPDELGGLDVMIGGKVGT